MSLSRTSIVLKNPANGKMAAWCPNAKIGTSTMCATISNIILGKKIEAYENLDGGHGWFYKHVKSVKDYVLDGKEQELCSMEMSFTFIRNPWERLISAFLEKVATRVILVPGFHNATFSQLIHALKDINPNQMNGHFMPVSARCLTGVADYTKVYKIEHDFEQSIAEAFNSLGVSRHHTLDVLKKVGARNQNSQHHRGLSDRREMYKNEALVDIVARLYADDIAFGRYAMDKVG